MQKVYILIGIIVLSGLISWWNKSRTSRKKYFKRERCPSCGIIGKQRCELSVSDDKKEIYYGLLICDACGKVTRF